MLTNLLKPNYRYEIELDIFLNVGTSSSLGKKKKKNLSKKKKKFLGLVNTKFYTHERHVCVGPDSLGFTSGYVASSSNLGTYEGKLSFTSVPTLLILKIDLIEGTWLTFKKDNREQYNSLSLSKIDYSKGLKLGVTFNDSKEWVEIKSFKVSKEII